MRVPLVPLLVVVTVVLGLACPGCCQIIPYTSGPSLWHTFDVNPGLARTNSSTSKFSWSLGTLPHTGIALFNGINNYLNLTSYSDDYGKTIPTTLGRSFTVEYWVQWNQLNSWSRILECGRGPTNGDNINIANYGNAPQIAFGINAGTSGNDNTRALTGNVVKLNTFQHVVMTVAQQNSSETTRGELNIYVDGVLLAHNTAAYLPRIVSRPRCWIGKSEWGTDAGGGDGYFSGWIDDFFYYDFAISAETVQVHYVLPRPPVYELTFSMDPRAIQPTVPISSFTYRWSDTDIGDNSTVSQFHNGHLVLNGSDYIDLAKTSRSTNKNDWIGTDAPLPVIGGTNSGANGTLTAGWTIEVLFKPTTVENWAKIYDFGSGRGQDNIILGYNGLSNVLRFEWFAGVSGTTQYYFDVTNLTPQSWYHVVVVMSPSGGGNSSLGAVQAFVNGSPGDVITSRPMPRAVTRTEAYIGKSHWTTDEYFDCLLDAFRLYDYALTAAEVRDIYVATKDPLEVDLNPSLGVYHTRPVTLYNFRLAPPASALTNSPFTWAASITNDWHQGIATFNGNGQWIDLTTFPDDYGNGQLLPQKVGGAISFECWVRWNTLRTFSRVFDLGATFGVNTHTIMMANRANTDQLMFEAYVGSVFAGIAPIANSINTKEWMHIIATVEQTSVNDTTSARSGLYSVYIDGRMRAQSYGYLPYAISRSSSWLGRSNYASDQNFDGAIDMFAYYDYALQYEQVAAHYQLRKPPVFELAFSKDPRPWLGLTSTTYQWEAYDPRDQASNNTQFHNGHLVLEGDSWVNLTATTGASSVGTTLDVVLFNTDSESQFSANQQGWTIEMLLKIETMEPDAKMFACGTTPGNNEISIGWYAPANNQFALLVYRGTQMTMVPIMDVADLARWYHIVITAQPTNRHTQGNFIVYIDGVPLPTVSGVWPNALSRPRCFLGRSLTTGAQNYFHMKLDTFRIIDYRLTVAEVKTLYDLTHSYLAPAVSPLYTTAPTNQYTFDYQPDPSQLVEGTNYGWRAGNDSEGHYGVAMFNGDDQWVNLLSFSDDAGVPFPAVYGNRSMSFESWIMFDSVRSWARIFDSGAGEAGDNVLLGMNAASTALAFHVYSGSGNTSSSTQINTQMGVFKVGQWQHVAVTIEDRAATDSRVIRGSDTQAMLSVYVDGQLIANRTGYVPRLVERPQTFLAKSHWNDALFQGAIDSFYYYNYALSEEQILVHAALPRPAIFDLSFSADPRVLMPPPASQYSYSWEAYDSNDHFGNGTQFHNGHLVLRDVPNDFVNLSRVTGANSVGLYLPMIGGVSNAIGTNKPGWSFEFTMKINSAATNARLIDWGNIGSDADSILLEYNSLGWLQFTVSNSLHGTASMDLIQPTFGEWIHVLVTMAPVGNHATWVRYVNGVQSENADGWFPQAVTRRSALIGKSNRASDPPVSAKIDNIRIYDYALTPNQAVELYRIAHDPNYVPPVFGSSTGGSGVRTSSSSSSARVAARSSSSSSSQSGRCPDGYNGWPNCHPTGECPCGGLWPNGCYVCPEPSSSGSSALSTGAIVGIVLGAVAAFLVIGGMYYWLCSGRSRRQSFQQFDGFEQSDKRSGGLLGHSGSGASSRSDSSRFGTSDDSDAGSTYDWRAGGQQSNSNQWGGHHSNYQPPGQFGGNHGWQQHGGVTELSNY